MPGRPGHNGQYEYVAASGTHGGDAAHEIEIPQTLAGEVSGLTRLTHLRRTPVTAGPRLSSLDMGNSARVATNPAKEVLSLALASLRQVGPEGFEPPTKGL